MADEEALSTEQALVEADAEFGQDDEVDALCALLDAGPGGESPKSDTRSDMDTLLASLAPAGGGSLSQGTASDHGGQNSLTTPDRVLSDRASEQLEPDLPEPTLALPGNVVPIPFIVVARFSLGCEVDLKQLAFGIRNAEFNPRKHGSVTIRLFNPRAAALVRERGIVTLSGSVSEEQLKACAKKIARLVQKCGYQQAVFAEYKTTSILCKVDLKFPVRLEALAARWRKNAVYEPEFCCNCVFRTRRPKCTYLVTAGGKLMISGLRRMEDIHEALKRVYPVFFDFQR